MVVKDKLVPKGIKDWDSLFYWTTGEWQLVRERLDDEAQYCPGDRYLFASLGACPARRCRCMVVGQDPYPQRELCTGLAFSTLNGVIPPSLSNIFDEYVNDLGFPRPLSGDLSKWCEQGVLLWNAYPSCSVGKPGSHHWEEWEPLTIEIMKRLNDKEDPVVFVLLGKSAAKFSRFVPFKHSIITSHPSPLGVNHGFRGSRIFSRVNTCLDSLNQIDWRLEGDGQPQCADNQSKR